MDYAFDKPFHSELVKELNAFTANQATRFPQKDILKMDMHCHDYNSDVPDELIGRILKAPETWLPTERLLNTLKKRGCDAFTITNHNNARSCYEQQDKGLDILTASEFSCMVPDFKVGIHVLTYGFTPEQEVKLNKLRSNIYDFQEYTCEHDIPTIWAHPLYHYTSGVPPYRFFKKMALLFERFEVINGQRDTWQNMLTKSWIESLDEETIDDLMEETGLDSGRYCRNIYKKSMSAGSDSHMGIFSGLTGSYLYVPNLENKKGSTPVSQLALEAIRKGNIAPYGSHSSYEKMTIAFLDYVCQIALYHKDPGMLRIMLHRGKTKDKLQAVLLSNAFAELRRHKTTMKFVDLFHNCFAGIKPHFSKRWLVSNDYKPVFDEAMKIADTTNEDPDNLVESYENSIFSISNQLNTILSERLARKIEKLTTDSNWKNLTPETLMDQIEVPSEVRRLWDKSLSQGSTEGVPLPDLSKFLDGLSFPFLAANFILAANFTSTKVLYNTRPLLEEFSQKIKKFEHPTRMLWLSDTYEDSNGVAMVLQSIHKEVKIRNLPIDILVCSNTIEQDEHLIVRKPLSEFNLPFYQNQPMRIPNLLDIHRIFLEGEYDRIMCSTEGPMGLVALYLKQAYNVPCFHYLHTDWITFSKEVLDFGQDNISRMRRFLRAYYKKFDKLFVLNKDQQKWLKSKQMGFKSSKVFRTAHWVEDKFIPVKTDSQEVFNIKKNVPVLLYAGRVSKEKGVMELPDIFTKVKSQLPDVQLVVAGKGPAEEELRKKMPEAVFMGWVDHNKLPELYSAADLLILPSKFDTFSVVVLEALSCGLPVVAYNIMGPKDIIKHEETGYLVKNKSEIPGKVVGYLKDKELQKSFKKSALKRANSYKSDAILKELLYEVGLKSEV
ncbi:glycosyltransferase [Reichenbachiella sp. MALMAid0571]|uniref:glycosyltransferase n=1 Tax=Reichenbachiella sp. MALMAid0571 TaxID=3143939 RepID=UPI0032DE4F47